MGARCINGVVLVADKRIISRENSEPVYSEKITGEIKGVLTGFSGDRGTFELFRNRLRNYTKNIKESEKAADIDDIIWQLHEIKTSFLNSRGSYKFELMIGVSSRFYKDGKSSSISFL